jgi:glycosyltransferase involved in cell wall biosynthesis
MPSSDMPDTEKVKLCIIVPHYKHANQLSTLLNRISQHNLEVIVVDDGSPIEEIQQLESYAARYSFMRLVKQPENGGKGSAVIKGLNVANKLSYTHALQLDADNQHDTDDIPKFIEVAKQHPDYLISGNPIFGDDAPNSRLWGRRFTNFWISVETLSRKIPDAMCGFRIYPVKTAVGICQDARIGQRMDFDIEFVVRCAWKNIQMKFVPTKVQYPETGTSHFNLIGDNFLITIMHTKLVLGMLIRLPVLIRRKLVNSASESRNINAGKASR